MSGLADAARLADVSRATWRALGDRLRALELVAAHQAALTTAKALTFELRLPLRRRRLRAHDDATSRALRLFCFDDALSDHDVDETLGHALCAALLDGGLLVRADDGRIRCSLSVAPVDGVVVFSDPLSFGDQAVMGPGGTTIALCRASIPRTRVSRTLDVGCGAGTVALCLARHAEVSIGVDLNARAIVLGEINAVINAITNVEFRVGDLFEPVRGERFDVIASQPPFVTKPDGAGPATWMFGGARGDALTLRLLAELPSFLAKNARAVVLAQWARTDDHPLTDAVRAALGRSDLALLSLEGDFSVEEYCTPYAATEHHALDASFRRSALALRDHVAGLGARCFTQALTFVLADVGSWTARVAVPPGRVTRLDAARIDARVRAHEVLDEGSDALLAAQLELAAGVTIERTIGAAGNPSRITVAHPSDPLVEATNVNGPTLELLAALGAAGDVGAAIERVGARHGLRGAKAAQALLPVVEGALRQGILTLR